MARRAIKEVTSNLPSLIFEYGCLLHLRFAVEYVEQDPTQPGALHGCIPDSDQFQLYELLLLSYQAKKIIYDIMMITPNLRSQYLPGAV